MERKTGEIKTAVVVSCFGCDQPLQSPDASLASFILNTLRFEKGFVDAFGCFEQSSRTVVFVSIWETPADAERYESEYTRSLEQFRWILEAGTETERAYPHRMTAS